jgi:hypothetical protein
MAQAWIIDQPNVLPQAIDETDTTQQHPLGKVVKAKHATYGEGEFVYLKGVASTVAGDVVEYDQNGGTTTRWAGTANKGTCLAVAMSANVANQYGWYQVGGAAAVNISGTVAAGDAAYWQATATVSSSAVNGKQVLGMIARTANGTQVLGMIARTANGTPGAGKAIYQIDRPHGQSQVA